MNTSTLLPITAVMHERFTGGAALEACVSPWSLAGPGHDPLGHSEDPGDWRYAVYEIFDLGDRPVYTGRSENLHRRLTHHRRLAPWWPEAASMAITYLPCLAQGFVYEELRIKAVWPRWNQRAGRFTARIFWTRAVAS